MLFLNLDFKYNLNFPTFKVVRASHSGGKITIILKNTQKTRAQNNLTSSPKILHILSNYFVTHSNQCCISYKNLSFDLHCK